ncbi:PREDICTED: uncharacterized protein LOC109237845 [Nicotiana attenuata]|uniref:uncharacterized protein LOC109237845 n=1 Tax=Nicotiana attenuata TaxID=49451 RepID=UPI000904AEC4|nr:PREDICTED: uncharacterized protein LOC109237845 [Nicotiana attenuata]
MEAMETTQDTVMHDEEADQLLRGVNKPKEGTHGKDSFKEKLIPSDNNTTPLDFECDAFNNISLEDENTNPANHPNFIPISTQDKERLYQSWKQAIIIKLLGKRLGYVQLRDRIHRLWRSAEALNLIDLGNDFYVIKFESQEIYNKALQQSPWFIGSQYLSIRQWEPKFDPYEAKEITTTIWIRLQDLPTEFYDFTILKRISQMLGTLPKIDNCTAQATRGQYARLCIFAPIGKKLPTSVLLGTHLQQIHYEDTNPICTLCGCLGHKHNQCTMKTQSQETTTNEEITSKSASEGPWKTVVYPKRKGKEQVNFHNLNQVLVPISVVIPNAGLGNQRKEAQWVRKRRVKPPSSKRHKSMINTDEETKRSNRVDINTTNSTPSNHANGEHDHSITLCLPRTPLKYEDAACAPTTTSARNHSTGAQQSDPGHAGSSSHTTSSRPDSALEYTPTTQLMELITNYGAPTRFTRTTGGRTSCTTLATIPTGGTTILKKIPYQCSPTSHGDGHQHEDLPHRPLILLHCDGPNTEGTSTATRIQ